MGIEIWGKDCEVGVLNYQDSRRGILSNRTSCNDGNLYYPVLSGTVIINPYVTTEHLKCD